MNQKRILPNFPSSEESFSNKRNAKWKARPSPGLASNERKDKNKFRNNFSSKFTSKNKFQPKSNTNFPITTSFNRNKKKDDTPDCKPLSRKAPPPLKKILPKTNPMERKIRDPRFDDLSGKLDQTAFNKNYKFVDEMKEREKKILMRELKEAEDEEYKSHIRSTLQRLNNQTRERNKVSQQKEFKKQQRKEAIESLKQGKKPYYKKNSELKLEMMASQFHTLKKENRLNKYLERKEKHKKTKELLS